MGHPAMKELLLKILTYPRPYRLILTNRIASLLFSYQNRLRFGALDRINYGFCIFQAAKLASLLHYPKISVIEFGCGGGNGLLDAEFHIANVMKMFAVDIELYGFDIGSGLPSPQGYRDIPHYFRPGLYRMDHEALARKLKRAKLVIGDVEETRRTFFERYDPAPIGCVFHDLDFYSSTSDALSLFETGPSHFLPRVFMYFDDIIGDDVWLCNEFSGERLAIEEFNNTHTTMKIAKNRAVQFEYPNARWPHQIYICHDFEHPKYNEFVGAAAQIVLERLIKLK